MKHKLILTPLLISLISPSLSAQNLFPAPAYYQGNTGEFIISSATNTYGNQTFTEKIGIQILKELTFSSEPSVANVINLVIDPHLHTTDEGYILQIRPDTILLKAASETGIVYAKEALLQLARFNKGKIRCCTINDAPRYQWRGFMLDESRHFFGKKKVKQYLDIMASLRLNVFHWHLTDEPGWRIEIKKYPKLTQIGAIGNFHNPNAAPQFYTQEDIKEIVDYAAERKIMVVPEFDMPGHATAVCRAYPEFSGGGEGRWKHFTFHPCKEETYQFISDVMDEIALLFPSPYIHIGGDEVHYGNQSWFTDTNIQRFIKDKGLVDEKGLEHYFIRRVADIVASKGKTMIGWDEIIDAGISSDKAVVMWWRHDREHQLVKALENGYRVILTPRRPMYADFIQFGSHKIGRQWNGYNPIENVYHFPEPLSHLIKEYKDQILGVQMSLWTEHIADGKRLDYMTFPRLIALAEAAWTPEKVKECSLFMQRLPVFLEFLDTLGIYYFNPLNPQERVEPTAPEKEDILQNG